MCTHIVALTSHTTWFPCAGDDNMTVESLRYDLAQLQSATDNFSKENKLGVGGFGVVYKVIFNHFFCGT